MSALLVSEAKLPSMDSTAIAKVDQLAAVLITTTQSPSLTQHVLHAKVYSRTILINKEHYLTGVLIKIPTQVIISGDVDVWNGEVMVRYSGYNVLPASANRKQVFLAHSDTYVTMLFATEAKTVEAAEEEFTDEAALLFSRYNENLVIITGE